MWPFQTNHIVELKELRSSYDYIIVGAGSAGCVLANRLSEDPKVSVLLLERGKAAFSWYSRIPLLSSDFQTDGTRSRKFPSVPQKQLDSKPTEIVIGNAFGGTSRINGMIYTRGLPGQYSSWGLHGQKGWNYDDLRPYFLKSEGAVNKAPDNEFHNTRGEWKNCSSPSCFFATAENTIRAAKDLGFPLILDINSLHEPIYGVAKLDHGIDASGRRSDTASAFLPNSLLKNRKDRLHVCLNALVTLLDLQTSTEGIEAKGVFVEQADKNGGPVQKTVVSATKEIILSAGAIGTPQLLLLSGVGPRKHLSDLNIEVKKDLPGVGSNLQDHMGIPILFNVPLRDSIMCLQKKPLVAVQELLKYTIFGEFLSDDSRNLVQDSTSVDHRSDPKYLPDIAVMAFAYGETDKGDNIHGGFSLWPMPVNPFSRGTVRLNSKDPREAPLVDPNFLDDVRDRTAAHRGVKLGLKLKEQLAANGYPIKDYDVPKDTSPSGLDEYIRERGRSVYHYTSSCRMAPEDDSLPGVVDDELRVYGIKSLRIVDASVFPCVLATHLQATVIAMAEKCSDMLREKPLLV